VSFILEVEGLWKRYGELPVLQDVSFSITQGETVALLGPSGCGKSTLLRVLLNKESYERGIIRGRLDAAGYLPQGGLLFPWKTVMENVELPLQIRGVDKKKRRRQIRDQLPAFGLAGFSEAYPYELSGGMKQRVGLLRTVMTGAPILFLDEPFGALDAITRHRLQIWLTRLISGLDRTTLFVTHDIEEAVLLAQRVFVLTDRPARVLGERRIDLSTDERKNRMSRSFVEAKDVVLSMIEQGVNDAEARSVQDTLLRV